MSLEDGWTQGRHNYAVSSWLCKHLQHVVRLALLIKAGHCCALPPHLRLFPHQRRQGPGGRVVVKRRGECGAACVTCHRTQEAITVLLHLSARGMNLMVAHGGGAMEQ